MILAGFFYRIILEEQDPAFILLEERVMKIWKFLAISAGALLPVTVHAQSTTERIPAVAYNPSPLGIYNQLKIKDSVTVRGALNVDQLILGNENGSVNNHVVIATQREPDGTIRLADVKIDRFINDEDSPSPVKLHFPQAKLMTNKVTVRNGGRFDADAGYSRTDKVNVNVLVPPNFQLPAYADVVIWKNFAFNSSQNVVGTQGGREELSENSHLRLGGVDVKGGLPCPTPNSIKPWILNSGILILNCNP